ncbi:MAG: helix-turn-helix domain-containing protein [Sandaracinaceae bacterium]|nr:helix-turn-helix domain-containing protein [Sandaracinaceae bacterium]
MAERVALSVAEAAEATGLSRRTVERLIRSGELSSIRIGRRRLVTLDALTELLSRNRNTSARRGGQTAARTEDGDDGANPEAT